MSRGAETAAVLAALVAYVALVAAAARTHSATFDEPLYLPAGYGAWITGDTHVNLQHPPLAKRIAALPLLFLDGVRFDGGDPAWVDGSGWKFGRRFLYQWNDADRLLLAGRTAIAVLAALTAGAGYLWTRTRWGRPAAAGALFLWLLHPEWLAHGGLATTDLPVAAFFFLSIAAFDRALERVTFARVALAGLALAGALLSKHSALVLVAILPLLVLAHGVRRSAWRQGFAALLLTAAVGYAGLWAAYGFRFAAVRDPAAEPLAWKTAASPGLIPGAARFAADHHLLPEAYACGLADLSSRSEGRRSFLMGQRSSDGWWYYLPIAFLLKSPLPLLGLLLVAGTRRSFDFRGPGLSVWLPAAAFAAFALSSRVNIGVRYLLPLMPFVFIVAGGAAAHLLSGGRLARALAAVLLAWYGIGTLRHHPHHLSFFNEAAGGPYGGYRYLADSNVDWGQDLKRLAAFVGERRIPRIRLSYFGTAPPEYYGIPHDLLPSVMRPFPETFLAHLGPGDVVVVSATNLQGVYQHRAVRDLMERLQALPIEARVGPSLFVFRSDFHWLLRPSLAEELGWIPQATASYRQCLEQHPDHAPEARTYLAALERRSTTGLASGDAGEPDEGAQ